jgi:cytochrome P450
MDPPLQRAQCAAYIPQMWQYTAAVTATWRAGETRDMLVEMRRAALLILMGCLFRVEFATELDRLWRPILKVLDYISPGLWILWPALPRPTYRRALRELDAYLYHIVRDRRDALRDPAARAQTDLLTRLCLEPELDDDRIRDQLLTMLIAGHDTSTALLAWTLYLLGTHPETMRDVRREMDAVLTTGPPTLGQLYQLELLDRVVKEALRLYPPIHIGNRRAAEPTRLLDYDIPKDSRVMYSIYLAHRDPKYWDAPEEFCPARFQDASEANRPPLTFVPFGGGPRNCIGAAFSQIEVKVVLACVLRQFDLELVNADRIRPHMGATLVPRPGVLMRTRARSAG